MQEDATVAMILRSTAFGSNGPIDIEYTADGEDISPALSWNNVPAGTRELTLICDDPDAPGRQPWVHWLIYKIPANVHLLSANVPANPILRKPLNAVQGRNSWTSGRTIGYRGPAPPPGQQHRYRFRLYALDAELPLEPGMDRDALLRAMEGHVLDQGELIGLYGR
jgi:hypothetical protein